MGHLTRKLRRTRRLRRRSHPPLVGNGNRFGRCIEVEEVSRVFLRSAMMHPGRAQMKYQEEGHPGGSPGEPPSAPQSSNPPKVLEAKAEPGPAAKSRPKAPDPPWIKKKVVP